MSRTAAKRRHPKVAVASALEGEPRETNAITSRLILLYVETVGGRAAVERVLDRAGLGGREALLLDEGYWFSYESKIALFEAAASVLDDPEIMFHVGAVAIDLNAGEGLKIALRALGSPRLVYQNVVRANAKFSGSHSMEILELGRDHATIAYRDLTSERRYHPLDCQYNRGLLACIPELFALPRAQVRHPVCGCRGGEACIYELRWASARNEVRLALASSAAGGCALIGTAVLAPALLPVGIAVAAAAAATGATGVVRRRRARWRSIETELRAQSRQSERLNTSLRDLVSELRLDEVLTKVTANARAAVEGKEFALLICNGNAPRVQGSTGLPEPVTAAIERWAKESAQNLPEPLVIDDVVDVGMLGSLAGSERASSFGSLCAAPLVFRGEHLGVLVALATQARSFLPRDIDLIQSYAIQAAIALANARLYQTLEELASHDHLTGLLNHREFHEAVAREIARGRRYAGRCAVVMLDLDRFKRVNDSHGHAEGDRVLHDVGVVLKTSHRRSDLAFRIGGDEFALILPEADTDAAHATAARVREAVAALPHGVDLSYGVAVFPTDAEEKRPLLDRADERLYEMKRDRAARRSS